MIPLHHRPHTPKHGQIDPVIQSWLGPLVSTTTASNGDGIGETGWAPSDSNGAVGATQYVQWVNAQFAVYDKASGTLVYGPVAGNTLWSGFGGPCETTNDGDPIAQYDKAANRWVMTQLANVSYGPPFYQCIAVSTTSDATGGYYRYAFTFSNLNDYPKLGVWPDGYYLSANMFAKSGTNYAYVGPDVCALNRNAMLAGKSASMQCFQLTNFYYSLLPSDLDGSTAPPAGSPNYFLSLATNSLSLWKFHVDWTTPGNSTLTGPTNIPVAAYNEGCSGGTCVPQPGTTQQLDSLGDRLMYRLAYRNFGDHESLVANHSVTANGVVGIRWYELRSLGSSPSVYQQGTYAPDSNYRWMGSIAMDQAGDIAVGYSVSSGNVYPAVRHTGRVPSDAPGTFEGESSMVEGSGSQSFSRWGDYSGMAIDPSDDCTFWYTNEYLQSSGSWSTRIASFKFGSCGTTTTVPTAPTGLVATPGNAQVSLSWNASSGATSYNVLRSATSGGSYSRIGTPTATSFTDSSVTSGTPYYYVVQAVNSAGTSSNSNEVSATPQPATAPAAPTNLTASGARRKINLSWTQSTSAGVIQNKVYRSTTGISGSYLLLVTLSATTSFSDSNISRWQTYYYMVTAVSSSGSSPYSNPASAASR